MVACIRQFRSRKIPDKIELSIFRRILNELAVNCKGTAKLARCKFKKPVVCGLKRGRLQAHLLLADARDLNVSSACMVNGLAGRGFIKKKLHPS